MVQWARRRHDLAVEFLSRACDAFERSEDLTEVGRVLTHLGRLHLEQGLPDEALAVLGKGLRIMEQQGDIQGEGDALEALAGVLSAVGRWGDAARAARRAVKKARAAGNQAREALARVTLARILDGQNRRRRAVEVLRGAVASLHRLGMIREAASASAELERVLGEADRPAVTVKRVGRRAGAGFRGCFSASHAIRTGTGRLNPSRYGQEHGPPSNCTLPLASSAARRLTPSGQLCQGEQVDDEGR